ncbi:hypothetical protein BJV85_003551 [Clostridium acetobutylicum]|uniref:Uncharacterized protein n=1 Tax=Clostridium acetobutylicum (strain ATCC 824 / DSM 792 / JCM 1419 / IAM 19013 / LMG 5710 / NBRC 13948 / NRRL B-527 / VKM B-1787 / 2291 / W) TaxID=272562 RepID=Q97LT8_CLOAB|nr:MULTISPECIES: hypothetical protein [Clostridium]AAK78446.1 Hypothetical protein CA_C0466 [Clostridium acetobutylicum ATCC 824]ADZ19516.1 Conserved hypothetical protein [Clostridium acetobutylicum EA 2018]AEI31259.1 hypothetical protein SMB_G0476 [Clostridium acetobutylicum DSM 1731]AWV80168.1 hypothetical protein DK921_08690 [Clostridium acetobutylicum]MBC2392349.1 hypothetical protein [Clostridium acetobutylicum]
MNLRKVIYDIKSKLCEYEFQLKIYFQDKIYGVYIYKNSNIEGDKYIEFMTIITDEFTEGEINLLKKIHDKLKFNSKVKGRYVSLDDVGKVDLQMKPYIYVENGKLKKGYMNIDYFTWWLVKNKAVGIKSPSIDSLKLGEF